MPYLLWICFCCFAIPYSFAQANPCHCLTFGLDFHEGAEELSFVPAGQINTSKGQLIQVYQEQNIGLLTAVAVLQASPPETSPQLQILQWDNTDSSTITFHAAWDFDLPEAYKRMTAFAQKRKKAISELHPFQFLPPMNSQLHLQVYLVENYKKGQWPLPKEAVQMQVDVSIPAHPFYSNWNAQSPFKMKIPYLQLKLAYLEDYQWKVKVEDGLRIIQELVPAE